MSEPSPPPMSTVWAAGAVQDGLALRSPYPTEKGVDNALTDTVFGQLCFLFSSQDRLILL